MLADIASIEKRMERLEKDLKKIKSVPLEKEFIYLQRQKAWLESEKNLYVRWKVTEMKRSWSRVLLSFPKSRCLRCEIGEDRLGRLRHRMPMAHFVPTAEQRRLS